MYKILMVLFLLIPSSVLAQTDSEVESLKGLKGVNVLVEVLNPDIEADGLSIDNIQTDVELKLRLAGIKVLTRQEMLKEPGSPYLYVNVNSHKIESGTYSFNIMVSLKQGVYLECDSSIRIFGVTTWNNATIGGVTRLQNVSNFIRDGIKDFVDEFINDYLSVNPK